MSGSNDHIQDSSRRYGNLTVTEAAGQLRAGQLIAVPTETVYGLAADSSNPNAVAAIYRTKGRPDFNPLIVHVSDVNAAQILGQFNNLALKLAETFWPGPLTLVVPKQQDCDIAPAVTAGLDTIALRCPAHPVMRKLLEESQLNLAAPSANRSGGISPTSAQHVLASLGNAAPGILDAGPCQRGVESTIVAVRGDGYVILRPGPLTAEELEKFIGCPPMPDNNGKIEAPGQLASHYAPLKALRLNVSDAEPDEYHIGFGDVHGEVNLSPEADLAEAASRIFAFLHLADASNSAKIAVAPIPHSGMGYAINDRLSRAAADR